MSDIKWIKITTNIFDDEKIKIIDTYPARDEILVIWFKLLTLAGKSNCSGLLFVTDRIAYTPSMLATIFNREQTVVEMALGVFIKYGMISVEDNEVIAICNWEKHQNIDGMEKIREQTRRRVSNHRNKQKLLSQPVEDVTLHVTLRNATEEDKEEEIRIRDMGASPTPNKFKKPSIDEIKEYASTGYPVDAERFYDHYESNGWKIGKVPMKDWKATVRNWSRRDKPKGDDFSIWQD